jgi:hypothetical protein
VPVLARFHTRKTDAPLKKKADRICQLPEGDVPLMSNEAGGSTAPEQSIACGDVSCIFAARPEFNLN